MTSVGWPRALASPVMMQPLVEANWLEKLSWLHPTQSNRSALSDQCAPSVTLEAKPDPTQQTDSDFNIAH